MNPLIVRCQQCGGDLFYDIAKQRYSCAHCGSEAATEEKKAEYRQWKTLRHDAMKKDINKVKSFSCPACGAQTIVAGDEVTAQCPFCQNTMIDARFAGNDIPEVIIPFKLDEQEAKAKLVEWIKSNHGTTEAKVIEHNLQNFTGCYLPYHIVRGASGGSLRIRLHDGSSSNYPFRAYLSHTLVNASNEISNLFLDGIEPFDFSNALEFDFGYLNHRKAKVQNISGKSLAERVKAETYSELYKSISKDIHTKEMSVNLTDDENESIPALMPVYIVPCKNGIAAAVNGQTGKVSVDTGKDKNVTRFWWIAPTLVTLAVGVAGGIFGGFALAFMGALVFGLVLFAIAHSRHHAEFVHVIKTHPKTNDDHNDTQTVFEADFGQGPVPAKLRFFTPWRIIKTVLISLAVIFLPVLVAIPVQLIRGMPLTDIQIGYGAAWYCIPGFFTIIAAGGLAKNMMYSVPLYYEILPNGKAKRRKLPSQKAPSIKEILAHTKFAFTSKVGCLVIGFVLFLLGGSVLAMIT